MTIQQSNGNIFEDLGFDEPEAANLQVRSFLMQHISQWIKDNNLTQQKAGDALHVSQSRISDLMTGKINKFTTDNLMWIMTQTGEKLVPSNNGLKIEPTKKMSVA